MKVFSKPEFENQIKFHHFDLNGLAKFAESKKDQKNLMIAIDDFSGDILHMLF